MKDEPLEVRVARIDMNVRVLLKTLPLIERHEKELFVSKVFLAVVSPIGAFWLANKLGVKIF